jgi:cytochrome c-type biogenesis protein
MAADVTILAALFAGTLSFLSPCVLPLVPPYLVYLAGASFERAADDEPVPRVKRETVFAALLFVAGFSTVFIALGAGASAIGGLLRAYSHALSIVAGIAIIAMGLHFLGLTPIAWLMREKRVDVVKPVGLWGAYAMGLAFAFGWTPCIGPILAAILAVAASEATVTKGAGLLAVYSAGLGIPFVIAALAVGPFAAFLARFRHHLGTVEKVMGALLVLTGIAFLTGWITTASYWLLEAFPALGRIG